MKRIGIKKRSINEVLERPNEQISSSSILDELCECNGTLLDNGNHSDNGVTILPDSSGGKRDLMWQRLKPL